MSTAPASVTPVLASLYACLLNKKLCNSPVKDIRNDTENTFCRNFVLQIWPKIWGFVSVSVFVFGSKEKLCQEEGKESCCTAFDERPDFVFVSVFFLVFAFVPVFVFVSQEKPCYRRRRRRRVAALLLMRGQSLINWVQRQLLNPTIILFRLNE